MEREPSKLEKDLGSPEKPLGDAGVALLSDTLASQLTLASAFGLAGKISKKQAFVSGFKNMMTSRVSWGLAGFIGVWSAITDFRDAKIKQQEYVELKNENQLMRQQLDQTGEALNQVANSLEVPNASKQTHVQRAAIKPPTASHTEQAIADKEASAKTERTVH